MSAREVREWRPEAPQSSRTGALRAAHEAMCGAGCGGSDQQMGQRWPIGCVALEITQRCNLDCTACYLSEHSEAVRDLPVDEIYKRIDRIFEYYGAKTDVQVTGGDPTLRNHDELVAIVRRIVERGLRPTLMTNGIKASAELLGRLAQAGLVDVAFHVDTTQERKGYHCERDLNPLRKAYMDNARAAGLSVMFNTTLHEGNFHEVPDLVRFFRENADCVRTAAFQLLADTGRGVWRSRGEAITMASAIAKIEQGAGTRIGFDVSRIGHPACTQYGLTLCAGQDTINLFDEPEFIARLQAASADLVLERNAPLVTLGRAWRWALSHPGIALSAVAWLGRKLPKVAAAWLKHPGTLSTLSFTVHDFMDAAALERERICACVFKVMTAEGPVSMCLHNAKRDAYILQPLPMGEAVWDPLAGRAVAQVQLRPPPQPAAHPLKRVKGRTRQQLLAQRRATKEARL